MRKTYEKPMIIFESFASSVNIAADCEVIVEGPAYGHCGLEWVPPGNVLFLNAEGSPCTGEHGAVGDPDPNYNNEDGAASNIMGYDQLCYHIPIGINMFNS